MSETTLTKPKRKHTESYENRAAQILDQINRLEQQMDQDHAESERLRADTQAIKARTEVTLKRLREQIDQLSKGAV